MVVADRSYGRGFARDAAVSGMDGDAPCSTMYIQMIPHIVFIE